MIGVVVVVAVILFMNKKEVILLKIFYSLEGQPNFPAPPAAIISFLSIPTRV